jgi:hypothetical protein
MIDYQLLKVYAKKYPEIYEHIYIKKGETDEKMLETIQKQFKLIYEFLKDDSVPETFKEMLEEALIIKKAYNNYIVGDWKKETNIKTQVSTLINIFNDMKSIVRPYYYDCHDIIKNKIKELHEYNISQPIPENLIGEVYEVSVTDDFRNISKGYNIVELYIPYYDLHMNLCGINVSQGGFNIFLNDGYTRYKNPPIKTVIIPPETAKQIYNSAKELILNRPEVYKYVSEILH